MKQMLDLMVHLGADGRSLTADAAHAGGIGGYEDLMETIEVAGAAPERAPASITFIGNATLLVRLGGCTILTDPSFLHAGEHVHVGYGLMAKRLREPALQPPDLPALDAIVLSHLHGDHWDPPAERALDRALPLITTRHAARALARRGFRRTIGLDVWESVTLRAPAASNVRITAVPAQHGPRGFHRLLPPTNGHVFETDRGDGRMLRIYASGDTLVHAQLREIPRRFPGIDVALLHLGGTRIPSARAGVLVTLDAHGGVEAVRILDPRTVVPVHVDDWNLFSSPLADFVEQLQRAGYGDRLQIIERGATYTLAGR